MILHNYKTKILSYPQSCPKMTKFWQKFALFFVKSLQLLDLLVGDLADYRSQRRVYGEL